MLNISFALTTRQVRDRIKTETRRTGWLHLVKQFEQRTGWLHLVKQGRLPDGVILRGVVKGMGLPKGTHPERITCIKAVKVWREPLNFITNEAVEREGFPGKSVEWFTDMFVEHNGGAPDQEITVIQFTYPWLVAPKSDEGGRAIVVWANSAQDARLQARPVDRLYESTSVSDFTGDILTCHTCRQQCTDHHFMCDRAPLNRVWCPKCFDLTPCGRGKHNEDCSTLVAEIGSLNLNLPALTVPTLGI